jgi:tetratricopeptide (TPR) repeat protein
VARLFPEVSLPVATPELKTIRRYGNIMEAELALMSLKAAGINAILPDVGLAASVGTAYVPTGLRLQVPENEIARAEEILETAASEVEMPEDFSLPAETEPGNLEAAKPLALKCAGCGATWELTEAERRERGDFKCPDCGTQIPKEEESTAQISAAANWPWRRQIIDLVKSKSAWKFLAVITGLHFVMMELWDRSFINSLPPFRENGFDARNWQDTFYRLYRGLIFFPVAETIILVVVISLLARIRAPRIIQIIAGAAGPCILDGYGAWQHGVGVIPGFILMAWVYTHWRARSWIQAAMAVVAMHFCFNSIFFIKLLTNQIKRDVVSFQTTGNLFTLDSGSREYEEAGRLMISGSNEEALAMYNDSVLKDPNNFDAIVGISETELNLGHLAKADAAITHATFMYPGESLVWRVKSLVLFREKRYDEAVDAGLRGVGAAPDWDRARVADEMEKLRERIAAAQQPPKK